MSVPQGGSRWPLGKYWSPFEGSLKGWFKEGLDLTLRLQSNYQTIGSLGPSISLGVFFVCVCVQDRALLFSVYLRAPVV